MGLIDIFKKIFRTPYKEIKWEGNVAYELKYPFRTTMWVVKDNGLHLYYNGKPAAPIGDTPLVYQKCSRKWISTLAQIKADIDGFWNSDSWWVIQTGKYLADEKRGSNKTAWRYIEKEAKLCKN